MSEEEIKTETDEEKKGEAVKAEASEDKKAEEKTEEKKETVKKEAEPDEKEDSEDKKEKKKRKAKKNGKGGFFSDVRNVIILVLSLVILVAAVGVALYLNGGGIGLPEKTSFDYGIEADEQVSSLADYKNIEVTLSPEYEVTDEAMNDYLTQILSGYNANPYKEVTDRTQVADGDYVMVDYTGYKDGEAFDNGSATDVVIDVTNNCAAGSTSTFIDGFSSGLVGKNVGDTFNQEVTFPEDYSLNTDLAGVTVTFEFTVKGIYSSETVTLDDLDDEFVNNLFGESHNITTVDGLREVMESDLENTRDSAVSQQVRDYMINNSAIDIPDEYLELRVKEQQEAIEKYNVPEGQTLEEYLQTYNTTVEDLQTQLKSELTTQIQFELVFGLVADQLDIEVDEDGYQDYMDSMLSAYSGVLSSEDEIYEFLGCGDKKDGKAYVEETYRASKAMRQLVENAKITYAETDAE